MKYLFCPVVLLITVMLSACSNEAVEHVDENIPIDQKTEIAFTLSAQGALAQTRADGTTHGFTSATDIVARYESYKSSGVGVQPADGAEMRTTRTVLQAKPETTGDGLTYPYSEVVYLNDTYKRYWDDAYSRLAYMSIYAIAVPGKEHTLTNNDQQLVSLVHEGTEAVSTSNVNWKKNDNGADANNVAWKVSSTQTTVTLGNEDLCYSNNIQADETLGKNGRYVWDFNSTPQGYKPEKTGATTHADGQMRIALQSSSDKTSTGHFDRGHLVFNHALTRMTINLKKGAGFQLGTAATETSPAIPADPFLFASGTNVKILGVPTQSTLNIKTGKWTATPTTTGNIDKMNQLATPSTGYDYTLQSQFIPGLKFRKDNMTPVLQYTIDDNVYSITEAAIYEALKGKKYEDNTSLVSGDAIEMLQGKNYVINIVVNKTAIASVTATLINWEYINTDEIAPENHYITITDMMGPTSEHCTNFDLYRANDDVSEPYTSGTVPQNKNWFKHYTDKATLSSTATTNVWKTNWFWESNKSFYHFRTVNKGTQITAGSETTDPKDYFSVTSGQLADANDYHWGAPMKSGATMKYDETNGYDGASGQNYIYPAIGSTTSPINIIEHHMMSNIHIVLHTDTKSDDVTTLAANGVTLKNGSTTTKVEINRFCANGTVEMARGIVNPTSDVSQSAEIDAPSTYYVAVTDGETTKDNVGETNKYSYRIVPQVLNRSTAEADKIGLTITTPDGNKYVVPELAVIKAQLTAGTQHHKNGDAVTRWYPGYDYTYHIRLHKTGIESITCSIVDWVKVNTSDINIGL